MTLSYASFRPHPENHQFRPISFCNTIYKAITKILVNEIRPSLLKIISPSQGSFLSSHCCSDSVILVQEALYTLWNMFGTWGPLL